MTHEAPPAPTPVPPPPPPAPDPKSCVRGPSILIRQYAGAGAYGPVLHGHDLGLRPNIEIWDRVLVKYLKGSGMRSGSTMPIDCEEAKKIRSDPALLAVIRKMKDDPDAWLAVETLPEYDWLVDTNEFGQPSSQSRVVVVARRRDAD